MAMMLEYIRDMDNTTPLLRIAIGSLVVTSGLKIAHNFYTQRQVDDKLKRKLQLSKTGKQNLLNKLQELKTPFEQMDHITGLTMKDVRQKVDSGELKIVDVLHAFQAKALTMDKKVNSVTEVIWEAEHIAEDMSKEGKKYGQLLRGIPVSIKDMLAIRGYDTPYGLSKRLFKPEEEDCVLVKVLRSQGAVPFVLSNMPQMGLAVDSSNPIYGESLNFLDHKRTPGGSSGGEGALVASGGSLLGFGTDLGGSIRIPSCHSGICGFKPSVDRISMTGVPFASRADKLIPWMAGPMCRDVDSIVLCMRALLSEEMYRLDPTIPVMPFNEELFASRKPMRIGYYTTLDGLAICAVPAVQRAVLLAKRALEAMGHELVPFNPPNTDHAVFDLAWPCLWNDGGDSPCKAWNAERIDPNLKSLHGFLNTPWLLKRILSVLWRPLNPDKARTYDSVKGCNSPDDVWRLHDQMTAYQRLFYSKWQEAGLESLIGPTVPFPAQTLGNGDKTIESAAYTIIYNLVRYPAGVVPVTKVTPDDEAEALKNYTRKDATHQLVYDMQKNSAGLPIGVMCVAMQWRDETSMRTMKDLEEGLQKIEH